MDVPAAVDEVKTLWIGDLQAWKDENYIYNCFVQSAKLIRDKQSGQLQRYGFVEFISHATADQVFQTYNGQMMLNVKMVFRLNWVNAGEKCDDTLDYTIFVGDLAADVTDYLLQETFRVHYPLVKGAKVVTDKMTMRSKDYGFVIFEEAQNDCTEALNLDDHYVKAYTRRIIARKELGKVKEAMDGAEFVVSVDPNNPQLGKQYSEIKALYVEKMAKGTSVLKVLNLINLDKKDYSSRIMSVYSSPLSSRIATAASATISNPPSHSLALRLTPGHRTSQGPLVGVADEREGIGEAAKIGRGYLHTVGECSSWPGVLTATMDMSPPLAPYPCCLLSTVWPRCTEGEIYFSERCSPLLAYRKWARRILDPGREMQKWVRTTDCDAEVIYSRS
ncbi:hypothetical protein GUJ93_ZPchr0002g26821 [Zizania palustris]|uniref:RRM domain-containing protein n=1 Tax=Zizania palustris TaxID=103762 RepID=A0A8J5V5D0_ZIZPA|nr:hypothetical protein GUJ93_ZPchr0002g26821 [Zizania palustris]